MIWEDMVVSLWIQTSFHRGAAGQFTFSIAVRHVNANAIVGIESVTSVTPLCKTPSETKETTAAEFLSGRLQNFWMCMSIRSDGLSTFQ
jgi:hypothetical protein